MAVTPNRGLELLEGTDIVSAYADAPDFDAKDNDLILDNWLRSGNLETYTPDLQAAISNPTYGTDAIRKGWFRRFSMEGTNRELVEGFFRIQLGTGAASGDGIYFTTMPTNVQVLHTASTAAGQGDAIGDFCHRDTDSVAGSQTGVLLLRSTVDNTVMFGAEGGVTVRVFTGPGSPTFAVGDSLSGNFSYVGELV